MRLARLQQLLTLVLLATALGWAGWMASAGQPVLAVVGALLVLGFHALVLGLEMAVAARVNRDDPAPAASGLQRLRAWWGEVLTAPVVFCWRQPFFPDAVPDDPGAPGRRGVVLVHGFICNRGLWTPWLRRLRARGIPFVAVNLEPVFGSIDRYAAVIEQAVRQLEQHTGCAPVLVGHSMGGLAIRAWMRDFDGDRRVHRVLTIGTPHRGTVLARNARTTNARQMRRDSAWLQQLASQEPAQRYRRFTCFYGHCDNVVFPASTATLPGADNRHVSATAHVRMAFHREVVNEVLAWLEAPASSCESDMAGATPPTR